MEEDGAAKAPVTRLRRRLSVEQTDESKSPALSTPTKKKGRLAAKPQLDLIDENAIPESPNKRTTRKSMSQSQKTEAEEMLTPGRKSTRTRSNTSLTLETEEELKLTPGRRSTRIRSNTSLLEVAMPAADTPRAKRAARRTSLLGSDGETALTPTKTRRTRKDSTSSMDVQVSANGSPVTPARIRRGRSNTSIQDVINLTVVVERLQLANSQQAETDSDSNKPGDDATFKDVPTIEVIEEEDSGRKSRSETATLSPAQNTSTLSPNTIRKSPRLMKKSPKTTNTNEELVNNVISQEQTDNAVDSKDQPDGNLVSTKAIPCDVKEKLSVSSTTTNLTNNLDKVQEVKAPGVNKSTSAIDTKKRESKRHRTKSWTTLSVGPPSDDYFHSDNEKTKKKLREKPGFSSFTESSSKLNKSSNDKSKVQIFEVSEINKSKKKKKKSIDGNYVENPVNESLILNKLEKAIKSPKKYTDTGKQNDTEHQKDANEMNNSSNAVKRLFEKDPTVSIQSLEFIEDSDSGQNVDKEIKTEDQCVPVIFHQDSSGEKHLPFAIRSTEEEKPDDRSIEPMDIDETMPENVSLTEFSANCSRNTSLSKSQSYENPNNSKRKSSISKITGIELEQAVKENISTVSHSGNRSRNSSLSKSHVAENQLNDKSQRKSSISKTSTKELEQTENGNEIINIVSLSANCSRNSSLSKSQIAESQLNDDSNKSKRKSTTSKTSTKELEQTENENKSTLVLSEINVSASSEANSSDSLPVNNNKSNRKSSESKDFDKSANKHLSAIETSVTSSPLTNGHISEKTSKKHALSTCLTSTPVYKNNVKKSNMQVNTSAITPITEKKNVKESKLASKNKSVTMSDSSGSEEDSDADTSNNRNSVIDDEAIDAGDDYESGDSQDEEERQYERENEIIDKGDTLTSDNDSLSTDSEYEKDSFIVTSDEEDSILLSGSGDDLNMSDNELTMSKKSKKKYDDRKKKEQKKASREMFEARHQLKSGKESGMKKDNRQRLDSTLSHSDDNSVTPKKNKRMRLESDSSFAKSENDKIALDLDVSKKKPTISESDGDEIGYKKKKSKRLSESLCNSAGTLDEKEMTLVGDSLETQETDDPLTLAIKREPKTPNKLDISTVNFTDRDEIEQIEVPEDVTMIRSNETSDPLQSSLTDNDDEDESLSENEETAKNYDTILENLNNQDKLPIKSRDISLNVNKETKLTTKEPIIEQLNLSVTKRVKLTNTDTHKKYIEANNKVNDVEESSSDSMDLKLLFSEDSNDGHKENDDNVVKSATSSEKIIPLKKWEGKTNLSESISTDTTKSNDLNTSKKKKGKRRKLSQIEYDAVTNGGDDDSNEIRFFIDTVGTYGDSTDGTTASIEVGSKKNTNETSMIKTNLKTTTLKSPSTNNSSKKNKITEIEATYIDEEKTNTSFNFKKNKNGKPVDEESFLPLITVNDTSLNVKSKKNKKFDESLSNEPTDASSKLKKNNTKTTELSSVNQNIVDGVSSSKSPKRNNNKTGQNNSLISVDDTVTTTHTSENLSSKKNKYKKVETSFLDVDTVDNIPSNTSSKKKKKNKAELCLVEDVIETNSLNISNTSKNGERKDSVEAQPQESVNPDNETQHYKKKRTLSDLNETLEDNNDVSVKDGTTKKKRKQKTSCLATEEPQALDFPKAVMLNNNPPKKTKLDVSDNVITTEPDMPVETQKKRKRRNNINKQDIDGAPATAQMGGSQGNKRKERDEEHIDKKAKVMKKSSLDEIHIPRLPGALLDKLEDKPNKEIMESKKSAVSAVATTDFTVEKTTRRKNKPSNFLEESVYLNEYECPVMKETKPKSAINKPKILPFIPIASTSDKGFTTNFQVRVLTGTMEFQAKNEVNFKTSYLQTSTKMKKHSSEIYKKYKKSLSKF